MTIFKCKMCGGTLEFNPGDTVAVCDSCGTKQTLPKLDDDRRANLYDRANHFRRGNEYDKAMGIYEQILAEDNTDAEAYWSLVLCRYGIEYVEDPATHRRVPTVNRAQFTSIFDDDNYKSALHYADAAQREVYESEAKAINEIQKGILAISQKEQPFDVFICYKETDAGGRRTPDSVLANDLYHQLTQEGFKVFFARITLEDKLGTAYEPYIFAALNSAKVMVVLGTKPEYFNAVWVKNEWSRYLALVKNSGGKKMLIPAYKDMDPYDLPEEFSHLQAQDMGKLGFMQDLIRGIKKITSADAPKAAVKETVVVSGGNAAVEPLLKRAFMFLEDGNWQEADTYCEKVLDQDPENAQAYLGKLMAQLHIATKDELPNCATELTQNDNYQKALRFADDALHTMLTEANEQICRRNAKAVYDRAAEIAKNATSMAEFQNAAKMFASIEQFEDAAEKREECQQSAEKCRLAIVEADKERAYNVAMEHMRWNRYAEALRRLEEITGWKDADELAGVCREKIEVQKKAQKKIAKYAKIVVPAVAVLVIAILVISNLVRNSTFLKEKKEDFSAAQVGQRIEFGTYEQDSIWDDKTTREKDPIRWIVLEKQDDRILVVSSLILDIHSYDESYSDVVTWEKCSLRRWLNNTFINNAFNATERKLILEAEVPADKHPDCDTDPGNATTDQIFLLSASEYLKYFTYDGISRFSDYADSMREDRRYQTWWLRTPGEDGQAKVFCDDGRMFVGYGYYDPDGGVRPAMWLSLE